MLEVTPRNAESEADPVEIGNHVTQLHFSLRTVATVLGAVVLVICSVLHLVSADKKYLPKSEEEEAVSLVLESEIKANGWTKKDLICFSVEGRYPSATFVKALRKQGMNVCSSAEWPKKFNCGFEVRLQYATSDSPQSVKFRVLAIDLREINQGVGDLGVTQRDGEYLLRKAAGNSTCTCTLFTRTY